VYVSVDELIAYLGAETQDDRELLADIAARAQAAVEAYTHRSFEAQAGVRRVNPQAIMKDIIGEVIELPDDAVQIASVTVDGVSVPFRTLPADPPYYAVFAPSFYATDDSVIEISGTWGFSETPPADIRQATLRLAAYFYRLRDAQMFDAAGLPDIGMLTVAKGLPADVQAILDNYRRL